MKVNIIYRQLSEIVYDTNKKALCGRGGGRNRFIPGAGRMEIFSCAQKVA